MDLGIKCTSLYRYTQAMRTAVYQYKGCGDYELRTVFLEGYLGYLKLRYRDYVIVPVPSFAGRDEARGFNHVYEIFAQVGLPMVIALRKTKDIKQADQGRKGRKQIKQAIEVIDPKLVEGKKVLLVDDIYTTGSTIRACISLLKSASAKSIRVIVLAKVDAHGTTFDRGL